jgi:hypothetical protein
VRSVGGVWFDRSRQQRAHGCFVFLSPLTHCFLLDSPQQREKQQTRPLSAKPHHVGAHLERHTSDSANEKAHYSSVSSTLPIPLTVTRHPSSEHLRIRHGSALRQPPHTIASTMNQVSQINPSASDNALLLHDGTLGDPRSSSQTVPAASLIGLPMELQKTILEYVSLVHLGPLVLPC